jgi:2-(1,2-epoxy-1,2-dihydrophenyl)acetyl-CoA isomerase
MNYETLQIIVKEKIATILLNRPERLNSFDMKLGYELYEVLQDVAKNPEIQVVVLRGTGKGFCGGGDVKEMHAASDKSRFLRDLTRAIHRCVIEIRTMEKPVIAAVNGAAFGAGLSLALSCDMIIAVKEAKMCTAFIGIGLAPGCGTQFMTKTLGYQRACEYILTSKTFTAEQGYQLGLVNTVVDADQLDAAIDEVISSFKSLPPIAVGKAKMLINKSLNNDMITHLELESKTAAWSAGTDDFAEGVAAFVEKRRPLFKGR